jgi:hypothetical protein
MDQGIIQNFKVKYRDQLLRAAIRNFDQKRSFDPDLWDAMQWTQTAWDGISQSTIANCFKHAGFAAESSDEPVVEDETDQDLYPALPAALYAEAMRRGLTDVEATGLDFTDCDDHVLVCSDVLEDMQVDVELEVPDSSDEEDTQPDTSSPATLQQGHDAIATLSNLFSQYATCSQLTQDSIANLRAALLQIESAKTQTRVDSFFTKL